MRNNKIILPNTNNSVYLLPIRVLLGFLVFTELLYFLGPVNYPTKSPVILLLYLIVANVFLYRGYIAGYKKRLYERSISRPLYESNKVIICLFIYSALAVELLTIANTWRLGEFSFSNIIGRASGGLLNPGEVYSEKTSFAETGMWGYILMILSPLKFIGKCVSVYFWKKISNRIKIVTILLYLFEIIYWLGIGVRKGLFDIILTIVFCIVVSNVKILKGRKLVSLSLIAFLFIIVFLWYFIYSNMSRYGLTTDEILQFDNFKYGIKTIYYDLSPTFSIVLSLISGYLCQGYYALSCVLHDFIYDGVFCFSYGLGHNSFLLNVMDHLSPNLDIRSMTYFNYLENNYNIDPRINWHTIYVWLANDFTLLGVFPVIYWIGSLLGKTWIDSLKGITIYACPLMVLTALCVCYFYANNQVFSFSFIPFWFTFMLYYLKRRNVKPLKTRQ